MNQTTIKKSIECSGVGLHGGKMVHLTMRPAPEDTGIVFDIHTAQGVRRVAPNPQAVVATGLATTLGASGNGHDASVATVEHLLAAIRGLEIDNMIIEVQGGEVPIMDGSAASFVMLLRNAGIRTQSRARRVLRIAKPISHESDGKSIRALPHDGFRVDYTIDFAHPLIGVQHMSMEVTPRTFAEVAKARTFGFLREVEYMHSKGLALGGSLDNAVVLDDYAVLNDDGLRFPDEFVRHKILDFIGDMAMLGTPLQGHFIVHCSGHALNNAFLRVLTENADIYLQEVTLDEPAAERTARRPAVAPAHAPAHVGHPATA